MTWKKQNYKDRNRSVVARGWEGIWLQKGSLGTFLDVTELVYILMVVEIPKLYASVKTHRTEHQKTSTVYKLKNKIFKSTR